MTKPLVVGVAISVNTPTAGGASLVSYPSTLDVSHELVEHVSRLIYTRRREQGARRRKLGCFQQALLALVHLRRNATRAQLGAGFGVSEATAWRYVDETISVLAAWAPGLRDGLAGRGEDDFVVVDGALISTDRVAADEPYHSWACLAPGCTPRSWHLGVTCRPVHAPYRHRALTNQNRFRTERACTRPSTSTTSFTCTAPTPTTWTGSGRSSGSCSARRPR
ncbi:hypothetical protein GTY82_24430 [Streptomyces sp. SID5476]|nr:hypothetical protein [Streptomyces sp. SID5476]